MTLALSTTLTLTLLPFLTLGASIQVQVGANGGLDYTPSFITATDGGIYLIRPLSLVPYPSSVCLSFSSVLPFSLLSPVPSSPALLPFYPPFTLHSSPHVRRSQAGSTQACKSLLSCPVLSSCTLCLRTPSAVTHPSRGPAPLTPSLPHSPHSIPPPHTYSQFQSHRAYTQANPFFPTFSILLPSGSTTKTYTIPPGTGTSQR
ncbi:hypothetical protein CVT25_013345 [Psilocybe cyanescens]|uniref:Uncharacterized protein n=1 Tax=Psilocybe cyanescens TaxID=93625 RepID=A0A409WT03_PSICY|nr:hypothetical protein CVT25_013345 [Psilocybe cyanescens]